ncbi:MAG: class I SAM-dependent methyltransferase [Gemmatimonadales bacterium]|nr:class I SAM-dependent methyltransferase [Gemmatimonadales bacterium]
MPCLLCGADDPLPLFDAPAQMVEHRPGGQRFRIVRCARCDLVYLNPRVVSVDLARFYDADYLPHRGESAWGRYAPVAARGQRSTDRARVRLAREAVELRAGSKVLDLGCGRPSFLAALVDATGAVGDGIDVTDAGWIGDSARWARVNLSLHQGELRDVQLDGRFDLITMWHALEHDYAPLDTLRRLRALSAPGGALVIEVPDHDSLTRRLHGPAWAGYHTPRHTAMYTPVTLRALLQAAGWQVVRQSSKGTLDPYVLWWLGRQERNGRSLAGDLEGDFLPFMLGKALTLPIAGAQRWIRLGVQTAVAK